MRVDHLTVEDFRSIWGTPIEVALGRSMTVLVGPNLAGKSTIARALALALDPSLPYETGRERPVAAPDSTTSISLRYRSRIRGQLGTCDVTVSWPQGTRVVDARPGGVEGVPTARPVIAWADDSPTDILARMATELGDEDPSDLGADMLPTLQRVLPEVGAIDLGTVVGAQVLVTDALGFPVGDQVIRATFAAAIAAHMVRRGIDLTAVIVEEPEAFLHPAAQEMLRDELFEVGVAADAPVVVTTESPFVVPRDVDARVIAVARDVHGRTGIVGSAGGEEPQATLLGGLFRDGGFANVLDRTATIAAAARGVLVVEGGTDVAYLQIAADVLGRSAELDDLAIHAAGGALPAALHSIVLRAETELRVFTLLDNDDPGRRAKETMTNRFGFENRLAVTTYGEAFDEEPMGAEAEDIWDWRLVERFVLERGAASIRGKRLLRADEWHFDLTLSSKSAFVDWLRQHARPEDCGRWGRVLDLLAERLPRDAVGTA